MFLNLMSFQCKAAILTHQIEDFTSRTKYILHVDFRRETQGRHLDKLQLFTDDFVNNK